MCRRLYRPRITRRVTTSGLLARMRGTMELLWKLKRRPRQRGADVHAGPIGVTVKKG
jgi:hypothetical protein